MWISSVEIGNFRCISSLSLHFKEGVNILVGENSVGKSSIFIAVSRLVGSTANPGTIQFSSDDLRYGTFEKGEMKVSCKFELLEQEQKQLLDRLLSSPIPMAEKTNLYKQLAKFLRFIELIFTRNEVGTRIYSKIGPMVVQNDWISNTYMDGGPNRGRANQLFSDLSIASPLETKMETLNGLWNCNNVLRRVGALILSYYKTFDEFRTRPVATGRSDVMESMQGSQVASVLLNLKSHTRLKQRNRYNKICAEFSNFIPSLTIEAVESTPGGGTADVQFNEEGKDWPIPLANIGAGIAELLTFLTNLTTQEDQIYVLEEPELHLHSQAKRRLNRLIKESANKNQIFVITHDEHFVDLDSLQGLIRLYTENHETQAAFLPSNITPILLAQLKTAMKDVGKREVIFARGVLLVEDESQQKFITECANKLSIDLDGAGITILYVGGHDAFKPYRTLVEEFKIPYICFRDKKWGSPHTNPPETFRALYMELEKFLEQAGFGALLAEAKHKVGTGKPRVAEYVANKLSKEQIPLIFSQLINDAVNLTKHKIVE